jgi:type IX secretion system PorP/SprF family membrane protein
MKHKFLLIIFSLLITHEISAQDPIFTQYFLMPQTINPSFTGFEETTHFGVIHRTQWPSLDLNLDTNYGFLNTWFEDANSGAGVSFLRQRENQTGYTYTQVNMSYAYRVRLGDRWFFRPSIEAGRGWKNFEFQGLLLEDQINIQTNTISESSLDALLISRDNIGFWDVSAGLLFNNENLWIGASAKHLNRPNISLTINGNQALETFFSVSAGYEFLISDLIDIRLLPYEARLMISGNYMQQGRFNRFDLVSSFSIRNFFVGATFITNPAMNTNNSHLLTSINALTGLQYENFIFGVSYDFNTSNIGRTGGVYELSLTYQIEPFAKRCPGCPDYQ